MPALIERQLPACNWKKVGRDRGARRVRLRNADEIVEDLLRIRSPTRMPRTASLPVKNTFAQKQRALRPSGMLCVVRHED
jgi:hypothetical protein